MLSLAPDALSARAAERLAHPQEWSALGRTAGAVWGEFANRQGRSYRVALTLPDLSLYCDCTAPKRPCRHAAGLALLLAQEPTRFVAAPEPEWLPGALRSGPGGFRSSAGDDAAYEQRLAVVREGMARCEQWLRDQLHGGLAGLPDRPAAAWNEMAGLLSDAQAPLPALELQQLRRDAGSSGWPQRVLRRLGRLYLLTQAFAAYPELPPETQADLRGAAGWFPDPQHPGDELLTGRWLVLASAQETLGKQQMRRTWLYSQTQRRYAFLEQPFYGHWTAPLLLAGTSIRATLRFAPGAWPQRAEINALHACSLHGDAPARAAPAAGAPGGLASLRRARELFGQALSMNPWLRQMPLLLAGVSAELDGEQWVLSDSEGYFLPLPPSFLYGWHLQALHGQEDTAVFGEWNGRYFDPLAVRSGGRWLALHILRGQK